MRISELARESGTSVATIKYYLREGLLAPGERVNAREASYGQGHVKRLRLVRAMVEVLGASIEQVRKILRAADDADRDPLFAMSEATAALPTVNVPAARDSKVRELLARIGFERIVRSQDANAEAVVERLSAAIDFCEKLGVPMDEGQLRVYAGAAFEMAESDFARIPEGEGAVEFAVLGTVSREPVLLAMRRAAHQEIGHRAASGLKESGGLSLGE